MSYNQPMSLQWRTPVSSKFWRYQNLTKQSVWEKRRNKYWYIRLERTWVFNVTAHGTYNYHRAFTSSSAQKIIYPFSPVRRILFFSRRESEVANSQKWTRTIQTNETRMHIRGSLACSFAPQINIKMSSEDSVPRKHSGLHQSKTPHLKGGSTGCTPKCQEQEMRAFYK